MGQRPVILLNDIGDAPFINNGNMDRNKNTLRGGINIGLGFMEDFSSKKYARLRNNRLKYDRIKPSKHRRKLQHCCKDNE